MRQQKQIRKSRRSVLLRACYGVVLLFGFSAGLKAQTKASDVPKLVQELNDRDPAVRGAAATALDSLQDPAGEPALIAGLKQSAQNTSAAAVLVRTLGRFKDANAVAAIAELLPSGAGLVAALQLLQMGPLGSQAVADATASDSQVTRAAIHDAFLGAPKVGLQVLPATLMSSKSAWQRTFIVTLLADCAAQNPWYEDPPRPAFVKAFLPAAKDSDPQVRIAVASAIGQLADTEKLDDPGMGHPDFGLNEALPVLNGYADDQDVSVRAATMDALGLVATAEARRILKKHLNDIDSWVGQHAAKALAAAQAAAPEVAADTAAPKAGGKNATTPKSAEARKLAEIKKGNDETAIPELILLLGDRSSLVRAAAADKLGRLDYRARATNGEDHEQNLSEVPSLLEALNDSHALVRAAAAEALGKIGDERAVRPLIALLKDSKPKVVVAAASALSAMVVAEGYMQDPLTPEDHETASKALIELLSSGDPEVRHAAASAFVDVGTVDDMKKIVPLLDDSDRFMQDQAAGALARVFFWNRRVNGVAKVDELEKSAGPALARALSMPEGRYAILSALSAMNRPPAEAAIPLMEGLKYNVWIHADGMSRPEIQTTGTFKGFQGPIEIDQAIDLLARTGSPDAEPLLVKFLNIINTEAGKHACAALAALGDARAVSPLLEVLQRKGVDLQPEAAEALAAFQDQRIVPALIQALQSDNYSLRGAAAGALGHFHDARVAPALVHSLTDEDSGVQLAVAKALGELGDPAAVEPLGRVVRTNYEAVRALARIKSPASVTMLLRVVQDKQVPNWSEAVSALARMDDPRIVPALIQTMEKEAASDPNSRFAVQCVLALGTIKDSRAVEPLKKLLGKPTMASQEAGRVLREMGVSPEAQN